MAVQQCPFFHLNFLHHAAQEQHQATNPAAGTGATTTPLQPYTNLPGPNPQEFFEELMKSQGAQYHLVLSKFMTQYGYSSGFPAGIIKFVDSGFFLSFLDVGEMLIRSLFVLASFRTSLLFVL